MKPHVSLLALLAAGTLLFAQGGEQGEGIEAFLDLLEQETDLATKSKKNVDYVPGMVTVIEGEEMVRFGYRTVFEALELVPGFMTTVSGGQMIRGTGMEYAAGKTKIMLNGVAYNDQGSGRERGLPTIPVELVERVEVVRGPGSALYGEFAFSGMINIVTKKGNGFFFQAGGYSGENLGVQAGGYVLRKAGEWTLEGALAAADTDSSGTRAGEDMFLTREMGDPSLSNAPGAVEDLEQGGYVHLGASNGGTRVELGGYRYRTGEGFGIAYVLPEADEASNFLHEKWSVSGEHLIETERNFNLRLFASYMFSKYGFDDTLVLPEGYTLYPAGPAGPSVTYPDGVLLEVGYEETRRSLGGETIWRPYEALTVVAGLEASKGVVNGSEASINYDPITLLPLAGKVTVSGEDGPLPESTSRALKAAYLQGEWDLNPALTVTAGARYDDYDDIPSQLSPRVAMVYERDGSNIFKTQYARSFRPPSFLELYTQNDPNVAGNPDLEHETMESLEATYIHKNGEDVYRFTLFGSRVENLITTEETGYGGVYMNKESVEMKGAELEWERRRLSSLLLRGHLSYVYAVHDDHRLEGTAPLLATFAVSDMVTATTAAGVVFRYESAKARAEEDGREEGSEVVRLDGTLFNREGFVPGLNSRLTVKNLLDREITLPSPPRTYPDDYPQPGRSLWLELAYRF